MKTEWKITKRSNTDPEKLTKDIGCSSVTAGILINRGICSAEDAYNFLNPSFKAMKSPFTLKDMDKAVTRICSAISAKQKILVFGDYDVDGVTATTLLYNFLRYIKADVSFYIPHRIQEGYSFNESHVTNILVPKNIDLVITVDCGADSHEAVQAAKDKNIDVIITDHHTISDLPPSATAIINPKQKDCTAGLEYLAGVGVAFYLIIALRKHLRDINFWTDLKEPNLKDSCDLVALGTIADIVPLIKENRIITKAGLNVINASPRIGLQAMIKAGKLNKQLISSMDIAFKIAPCINAAGRLQHAGIAVNLLNEKDPHSANLTAENLNKLNKKRQSIEHEILEEIIAHIDESPSIIENKSIVLFKQGWHIGVLGIVASRLVKKYHLPVILIALDGTKGKGSGRSIPGINLYNLLAKCSDTLDGFGGHSMAAGLSIKTKNLPLFTKKFNTITNKDINASHLQKCVKIDYKIPFEEITPALLDELEKLQPFGSDNPEPLFIADDITIVSASIVGKNHRKLVVKSTNGGNDNNILAMHFNTDITKPYPEYLKHMLFKLQWNRWNNAKSMQIIIDDYS